MAERRITVCDYPGCGREDAEHYEITRDGDHRWSVDLCPDHGKSLVEIAEMGHDQPLPMDLVTNPKVLQNFRSLVKLD